MDIFTFSQREGEQNNDLYIANGRDVALGDPKRESIYSLSSDIQENGHKVFVSEEVDVWSLGRHFYFVFHTDSRDSVGRVVDAMVIIESENGKIEEGQVREAFEAFLFHCKKAGLSYIGDIYSHVGGVCGAVQEKSKKTLLQKLVEWVRSLLQRIKERIR